MSIFYYTSNPGVFIVGGDTSAKIPFLLMYNSDSPYNLLKSFDGLNDFYGYFKGQINGVCYLFSDFYGVVGKSDANGHEIFVVKRSSSSTHEFKFYNSNNLGAWNYKYCDGSSSSGTMVAVAISNDNTAFNVLALRNINNSNAKVESSNAYPFDIG